MEFLFFYFTQAASMILPMDGIVRSFIREKVEVCNVTDTNIMKGMLEAFIHETMDEVPPKSDSRYWPSTKTIHNCIQSTVNKLREGRNDQVWENVTNISNFFSFGPFATLQFSRHLNWPNIDQTLGLTKCLFKDKYFYYHLNLTIEGTTRHTG